MTELSRPVSTPSPRLDELLTGVVPILQTPLSRGALAFAIVLLVALAAWVSTVNFWYAYDDALITYRFARNLATGVGLVEAARKTFNQIQGANVVVLMSADEPDKIVTARIGNAGGVVLGMGEGENFVASDTPAIMEHTRSVIFLESRQMAVVTRAW